jgi:hypothetical protein
MHIIKVQSWLNGSLSTLEEVAFSAEEAMAKVETHHEYHSKHSHGHTIKVYDDHGELIDSREGSPTATNTYA